jgi:hypothetical protein
MTLVHRAPDANGGEIRTVSLVVFLSVVGSLCSVIAGLGTWAVASVIIPEQIASRVEARIETRFRTETEGRNDLRDRIAQIEDRFNKHVEAVHR